MQDVTPAPVSKHAFSLAWSLLINDAIAEIMSGLHSGCLLGADLSLRCSAVSAGSPSPSGGKGKCPCNDQSPDTTYSCSQQKMYGKCDSSWMSVVSDSYPNAFCAKTCGRCPASCSS